MKKNMSDKFPEVSAKVHKAVLDALDTLDAIDVSDMTATQEKQGMTAQKTLKPLIAFDTQDNSEMVEMFEASETAEQPKPRLKQRTENEKENNTMFKNRKNRYTAAAVIGAAVLAAGSITGYAALKYLTPSQAALELDDNKLAKAFEGEKAILINETQKYDDYTISLFGVASGADISDYILPDSALGDGTMYAVLAMEKTDGTPMPDTSSDEYGSFTFFASPYIQGLAPKDFNIYTLGTGYSEFVKDGVQYRLLEFDDISIFADRTIYIGVSEGMAYDVSAYIFDETTGEISKNPGYSGINALFTLPIDKSCADEKAAQECIDKINAEMHPSESSKPVDQPEMTDEQQELDAFMSQITGENIGDYLERVESTVQTLTPDKDNYIEYSWELESGAGGNERLLLDWIDIAPGETMLLGWSSSGGTIEGLCVPTLTDKGDGTYTFAAYIYGQD